MKRCSYVAVNGVPVFETTKRKVRKNPYLKIKRKKQKFPIIRTTAAEKREKRCLEEHLKMPILSMPYPDPIG